VVKGTKKVIETVHMNTTTPAAILLMKKNHDPEFDILLLEDDV
jgi:hypothetical protein